MRIAFIAMSGIRACDTELLQLGLTLPGFVERSKAIASLPSLGLLTLAGMTPARHIKWFTETDLTVHEDEALLHLMRDAGCAEVLIGFESPVPAGLNGLELRRNFKHDRQHQCRRAIERIQAAGIRVNACFVLGLDGQGPWVFDAVRDFVRETLPFDVQITVPTAFPGTPFYERLKREGRLLEDGAWERCTLFDVNYLPQGMSVEQLRAGLHRLAVELYGEDFTRERREHFKRVATRYRHGRPRWSFRESGAVH